MTKVEKRRMADTGYAPQRDVQGSSAAVIDAGRADSEPRTSWWARFAAANKRFCKQRLQPRLFPVSHMTALDYWYGRRADEQPEGGSLLEFGCGRTFRITHLVGSRFARRCATDLEAVAPADVPDGVTFAECTAAHVPFDDASFDLVALRSVIEHVADPHETFRELARVTRPGGRVLMNLPNKWDYVSVIARLSGRFKSTLLKQVVRATFDDFPVLYRCNTRRSLTRVAHDTGFEVEQFMPLPSQPAYLQFFVPFYVTGAIYQFVISLVGLDVLQPSFIVVLRKRTGAEAPLS